jgi:hypothetical protein
MFKIGDWVKENRKPPYKITDEDVLRVVKNRKKSMYVGLWKPQENEWIWVNGSFGRCVNIIDETTVEGHYIGGSDFKLDISKCEPFIGELPTFLRLKYILR